MRYQTVLLCAAMLCALGCHPGPVLNRGPQQPSVGGTIAGIVTDAAMTSLAGRTVTATEVTTGTQYQATTGTNGGYTIKVAEGMYRIMVNLQPGEALKKQPSPTRVANGDLDPGRDFIVTLAPA